MGYGKTTAVNWYLEELAKAEPVKTVRISVYSNNLTIFWKSVQDAFARAGFDFLRDYACPTDAAEGGLLMDDLVNELAGETSCYVFFDDFHLLTDASLHSSVPSRAACPAMCISSSPVGIGSFPLEKSSGWGAGSVRSAQSSFG